MDRPVLHQFVPALLDGDAVGSHTRHVQRVLREHGVESEIFAVATDASLSRLARPYTEYEGGTAAMYQFAVGHDLGEFVRSRADRLVVNSHNVTPPAFFARWRQPGYAAAAQWGLEQLRSLAPAASLGLAVSKFNARGMSDAGYDPVEVAPILMDDEDGADVDVELFESLRATRRRGSSDWLFTGRVVPNKAQHDLVRAFAAFRRDVDDGARLWIVGRTDTPMYERALRRLISALDCDDAVQMTGAVPRPSLLAHLANADVYVCLSDHEGFCVPLVEAMRHSLPIVAFDAGAVAETLGGAGLLLDDKRPAVVAAAVQTVLEPVQRARLVVAGHDRAAELSLAHSSQRTWAVLSDWLECAAR
jgi:L-malate glycosyltransferase